MAKPHQDRGPRWRRLVVPFQRLAGLDQRERFAGIDAQGFQHFGCQHLADAALQRQPAVGGARPGSSAGTFRRKVEEATVVEVIDLREEEAAAVAEKRVVGLKLMAMVAQRQRLVEAAGQRFEAAEMGNPLVVSSPSSPIRSAQR